MNRERIKRAKLVRRVRRVRKRVSGDARRPRLAVYPSLANIYAQVVDDVRGVTLAAASSRDEGGRDPKGYGGNCVAAGVVGKLIAERARAAGVEKVVFDRRGRRYHGRIKALAEAAREGGLSF